MTSLRLQMAALSLTPDNPITNPSLGTLSRLPLEVRRLIYREHFTATSSNPRKHRLALLRVSKAMHSEIDYDWKEAACETAWLCIERPKGKSFSLQHPTLHFGLGPDAPSAAADEQTIGHVRVVQIHLKCRPNRTPICYAGCIQLRLDVCDMLPLLTDLRRVELTGTWDLSDLQIWDCRIAVDVFHKLIEALLTIDTVTEIYVARGLTLVLMEVFGKLQDFNSGPRRFVNEGEVRRGISKNVARNPEKNIEPQTFRLGTEEEQFKYAREEEELKVSEKMAALASGSKSMVSAAVTRTQALNVSDDREAPEETMRSKFRPRHVDAALNGPDTSANGREDCYHRGVKND